MRAKFCACIMMILSYFLLTGCANTASGAAQDWQNNTSAITRAINNNT